MPERAYTVAEIDRMRDAVEHRWLFEFSGSGPAFDGGAPGFSRSYRETDKTKCVEELLRTYMLAGVGPEELERPPESVS